MNLADPITVPHSDEDLKGQSGRRTAEREYWHRHILRELAVYWPDAVKAVGQAVRNHEDENHFDAVKLVISKLARDEDHSKFSLEGVRVIFAISNGKTEQLSDARGEVIDIPQLTEKTHG